MNQTQIAEFVAAHPVEVLLAVFAFNMLGITGLVSLLDWLHRRRDKSEDDR